MTPSETAELLGTIQAFDRRTVGEADILAWHVTLADVDLADAKAAVLEHFSNGKDWLMPSDIKGLIAQTRTRRIGAVPSVTPPWQLADDPTAEQRWVSNYRHAIADGMPQDGAIAKANYLAGIEDEPEPLAIEEGKVTDKIEELRAALTDSRRLPPRMPTTIRRIPAQWAADEGLMILDPDGWREVGADVRASCTEAEYRARIAQCTVGPFERMTEPLEMPPVTDDTTTHNPDPEREPRDTGHVVGSPIEEKSA